MDFEKWCTESGGEHRKLAGREECSVTRFTVSKTNDNGELHVWDKDSRTEVVGSGTLQFDDDTLVINGEIKIRNAD